MSDQYLSEIRIMAFGFAPKGWAQANGQTLSIQQNAALFSLLGTTYGGNGTTNFMLPNLQSRVPVSIGTGYTLGQIGGEEQHTLVTAEMPGHNHGSMQGTATTGGTAVPINVVMAGGTTAYVAGGIPTPVVLPAASVTPAGGDQPHENRQPYLALNFCIALVGIFPSRN
jgi:microcystin-dependent protein